MGCSSSKDEVAVPPEMKSTNGHYNGNKNLAWSDDAPSSMPNAPRTTVTGTSEKPASASSRKSNKSHKSSSISIRVRSAGAVTVTEVTPISSAASRESLRDQGHDSKTRGVSSAKSIVSTGTCDSGFEADCPGMITEHSNPNEIKKIEDDARPTTPDLSFSGTGIEPRKRSGKAKPQTAAAILGELKSEGLLAAAPTQAQNGLSFEVMIAPEFGVLKRPPPRLAKLKKRKKKTSEMTIEEVEAKQRAAEQRRKRKEAKMIEKLNTSAKERQVHSTLDASVEVQRTQIQSKVTQDLDAAAQRREEHFRLHKQKMEEKKRHAEKVRQAKMERMAQTPAPPEDGTAEGGDASPV